MLSAPPESTYLATPLRFLAFWVSYQLACAALLGCSTGKKLQQEATPSHPTQLQLTITPSAGISVLIDQKRVGDRSPFVSDYLAVGEHQLLIRAMGHYSYEQTITITADGSAQFPLLVSLRPKSSLPPIQRLQETKTAFEQEQDKSPEPQPALGAHWPHKIDRNHWQQRERILAVLIAVSDPKVPIWLDGYPVDGKILRLSQRKGRLRAGPLTLRYQISETGEVQLLIPDDGCAWSAHEAPLLPGTIFPLANAAVRIVRKEANEAGQSLLLRLQSNPAAEEANRPVP